MPRLPLALAVLGLSLPAAARAQEIFEPGEVKPVEADPVETGSRPLPSPLAPGPVEALPGPDGGLRPELPAEAPNLLILVADDHAALAAGPWLEDTASWLATADAATPLTPQLARLCAEGARFRSAWTTGLDEAAARRALLDGHHPARPAERASWSLPAELRERGYATALFGHWPGATPAADSGFAHWEVTDPRFARLNPLFITPRSRGRENGHEAALTAQRAQVWIGQQQRNHPGQPFLVVCQFHSPGPEPLPTPATADLWGPELLRRADNSGWRFHPALPDDPRLAEPAPPAAAGQRRTRDLATDYPASGADCFFTGVSPRLPALLERLEPAQRDEWLASYSRRNELRRQASFSGALDQPEDRLRWESQRFLRQYLGAVRAVDAELGSLLDFLDRQQLAGDTLVVYTSDQGAVLGGHGLVGQNWSDAEAFRVPLALRWPGYIPAGLELDTRVQLTDLAPTLLELVGLRVSTLRADQRIDGLSHARPLLRLADVPQPRPALLLADSPEPPFRGVIDDLGFSVDPAAPAPPPAGSTGTQPAADPAPPAEAVAAAQAADSAESALPAATRQRIEAARAALAP